MVSKLLELQWVSKERQTEFKENLLEVYTKVFTQFLKVFTWLNEQNTIP